MLEYILGAIVVIFIMKWLFGGKTPTPSPPEPPKSPKPPKPPKPPLSPEKKEFIDKVIELIDDEDTEYNISEETNIITGAIKGVGTGTVKVESTNKKSVSIDLLCFKDLSDLLKATDIVYSNAEMTGKNRMNESLFRYYCRLHYRSHLADQLCRQKSEEIFSEFSNVNALIVRLNDKNDPLRVPKNQYDQIIRIKDLMKNALNLLKERSKRLSIQTGIIRDKIGEECGARGHEWWLERKENAKNAEFERTRNQ